MHIIYEFIEDFEISKRKLLVISKEKSEQHVSNINLNLPVRLLDFVLCSLFLGPILFVDTNFWLAEECDLWCGILELTLWSLFGTSN